MRAWRQLTELIERHGVAALITVHDVKGSAPREKDARMVVRPDGAFHGTIGGGQLEFLVLDIAHEMLKAGRGPARIVDQALGPDLGQCCGGRVKILIETFDKQDLDDISPFVAMESKGGLFDLECRMEAGRVGREMASEADVSPGAEWRETHGEDRTPVLLFGAGHVGRALVLALAPLPFSIRWLDDREGAFPAHVPANTSAVQMRSPEAEIAEARPDSMILVMTHDHPLDMAIAAAALQRGFPYVGLIGSATKRARFEKRFRELGLPQERIDALICPIGVAGVADKDPAVIAASVAAQLLQTRERRQLDRKLSPLDAAGGT
ncbi:xanthine dehydrogenase accessory protein XdhC [Microvirga guangxiensis]|uniref:Xanthine dehydrogenase accessory factor n=1 Tax=Microvirga guangxiensis TaxID=549386 RepID=A0A1G5C0U9_9HYPH|nr:xanthine dehydrogenase accessory protein XdhC [Microvirga guangxiensis]SCX95920.1 xanthine dehydrogenase accessory factor [Microvirga guangxiensis]